MSRVEEIKKQMQELEKKTQELQKELEFEKNKYVVDYPFEIPDSYWRLELNGVITKDWWGNEDWERHCYKQGNIFLTKEEAEKEHKRRELLIRFKQYRDKFNGDWKPDWKYKSEDKFCILFNHELSELVLNWYIYVQPFESFGCFKNREDAQRAIELFGDEIKRLYVEE